MYDFLAGAEDSFVSLMEVHRGGSGGRGCIIVLFLPCTSGAFLVAVEYVVVSASRFEVRRQDQNRNIQHKLLKNE